MSLLDWEQAENEAKMKTLWHAISDFVAMCLFHKYFQVFMVEASLFSHGEFKTQSQPIKAYNFVVVFCFVVFL